MKIKAMAISLLAASSLVACQPGEETGVDEGNFQGAQNTTLERNADQMDTNNMNNGSNMQAQDNRNNMGNQGNNNMGNNNGNNYDVAEQAANNIARKVEGVKDAYVLTTQNNAYVAAELDNNNGNRQVSDEIEQQITKVVKGTNNNIDNVYVSSNPDFIDLTNNYANNAENGEPAQGFFRQFGEMVDRIFPDAE